MNLISRTERFTTLFPDAPAYRLRQCTAALFESSFTSWKNVTTLPKAMRERLEENMPWMSIQLESMFESKNKDTFKALLVTIDGKRFESVLMANARDQWTVCVSCQIGCAMGCVFCATGAMGFTRSLLADEIADQLRFWRGFLRDHNELPRRISNIVFMGMGEPMANYENVKHTIRTWLDHTDIGPTRITVSTVGVLPQLEKLLADPDWPSVRIAISLHSANQTRRKAIVPTTVPNFLEKLAAWSHAYEKLHGNRRHHITYEYTLISGVNDTAEAAKELGAYIRKTGVSKINLIPWNPVRGKPFSQSAEWRIAEFKKTLRDFGLDVTQRRTMGDDIAAACGQLAVGGK